VLAAFRDEKHNPEAYDMREYTSGRCGMQSASLCRELPGRSWPRDGVRSRL